MEEQQPQEDNQAANWQFVDEATEQQPTTTVQPVTWTASEFIAYEKGLAWYGLFFLVLVAFNGVIYLLTRDLVTVMILAVVGILFALFANRAPKTLEYKLDDHGLQIGPKFYPYHDFKSFALHQEGALPSLWLLPLRRFAAPITVYYDPKEGDTITDTLALFLPLENKEPDAIDKLMARIRF